MEFNASTPFQEQLNTIAQTGVFVSAHTSNLANSQFLQPGSAVVEILQRNWIWHNLDKSFQVHNFICYEDTNMCKALKYLIILGDIIVTDCTYNLPHPGREMENHLQVQTDIMGDIHHYAWRAKHRNQTVYIDKRDGERFGDWASLVCSTEECVEAHTNIDIVVNLAELKILLDSRLPLVFTGASVAEAALPWPVV